MSDEQTPQPTPEPTAAPGAEPAAVVHTPPAAAVPPVPPAAAPATPAAASSNRPLWIGLGAGAAVVAVGLVGAGVAMAVSNHHDLDDRYGMMGAPYGPGGNGYGADRDDDFGGMMGGQPGEQDDDDFGGMMGGQPGMMGGAPGMLGGLAGAMMGGSHPLHASMVIEDASGDPVTVLMQTGEVKSVSATSVTVTSSDGYSHTYVIDEQTRVASPDSSSIGDIDGISDGDSVSVVGQDEGDGTTARLLVESDGGLGMMGRDFT